MRNSPLVSQRPARCRRFIADLGLFVAQLPQPSFLKQQDESSQGERNLGSDGGTVIRLHQTQQPADQVRPVVLPEPTYRFKSYLSVSVIQPHEESGLEVQINVVFLQVDKL